MKIRIPQRKEDWAQWLPVIGGVCILFTLMDLLYEKHPHVVFEAWFNFYGFFAIIAAGICLALPNVLRSFLKREEDYYDG